jgi:hypothetical protein
LTAGSPGGGCVNIERIQDSKTDIAVLERQKMPQPFMLLAARL